MQKCDTLKESKILKTLFKEWHRKRLGRTNASYHAKPILKPYVLIKLILQTREIEIKLTP